MFKPNHSDSALVGFFLNVSQTVRTASYRSSNATPTASQAEPPPAHASSPLARVRVAVSPLPTSI